VKGLINAMVILVVGGVLAPLILVAFALLWVESVWKWWKGRK